MMQARLRGIKSLTHFAQRMMRPAASLRVFSTEAVQAQTTYEHMSNMKTKDLFQFEPFNSEDLLNFPRESEGKDYSLNWALASEWFTVWGNAYRNPSVNTLQQKIDGNVDNSTNVTCSRHYLPSSQVQTKKGDFEEISDSVKEFLSQVPNLYVEDAAVCSGRCAEMRIRSVTNDPVTAMALKNLLHRMPKRDPMTPHPLSVIVARGMSESYTAIGMDPHSKALTVIATGDTPIDRIIEEIATATSQQMETARGTIEITLPEQEPGKGPVKSTKKGPITQSLIKGGLVLDKDGNTVLCCGLSNKMVKTALDNAKLFCSSYSVLTADGMTRLFAGEHVDAAVKNMKNAVVVNNDVYVNVAGDNLLSFPNKVLFVDGVNKELSEEDAVKKFMEVCKDEEAAKFTASTLKKNGASFMSADAATFQSLF